MFEEAVMWQLLKQDWSGGVGRRGAVGSDQRGVTMP